MLYVFCLFASRAVVQNEISLFYLPLLSDMNKSVWVQLLCFVFESFACIDWCDRLCGRCYYFKLKLKDE